MAVYTLQHQKVAILRAVSPPFCITLGIGYVEIPKSCISTGEAPGTLDGSRVTGGENTHLPK